MRDAPIFVKRRIKQCSIARDGAIDTEEFSIIEYTSFGAAELRDTESHAVRSPCQCVTRLDSQFGAIGRGRHTQEEWSIGGISLESLPASNTVRCPWATYLRSSA